jgi:hypothetical protein
MQSGNSPLIFWQNELSPCFRLKNKTAFFAWLTLNPEDGSSTGLWNVVALKNREGTLHSDHSENLQPQTTITSSIHTDPLSVEISMYTGCPRRNVPDFGRVILMVKYTDITQSTNVQSWTVMEIMAREKCGFLAGPHTVPVRWQVLSMCHWVWCGVMSVLANHVSCIVLGTLRTKMTCMRVLL